MISIRKKKSSGSKQKTKAKTGFLNFSQKVDYGLFLLSQLANQSTKKPLSLKEVANENQLSFFFLQRVAVDLRQAGLISAERGKAGGYRLSKPVAKISMKEVLEAIEGPIALLACLNHSEHSTCLREDSCLIKKGLGRINNEIVSTLTKFTLSDFLNENG